MKSRTRNFVIAGALIAVIAIVYFSFFYPPVSSNDTTGTIGKAQKYRAQQMTDKDVVLQNAHYQKLIQSDKFQKLLKDEKFRKLAKDPSFRKLLKDPAFYKLVKDARFQEIVKDAAVTGGELSEQTMTELSEAASSVELAVENTELAEVVSEFASELAEVLSNSELAETFQELQLSLSEQNFELAIDAALQLQEAISE